MQKIEKNVIICDSFFNHYLYDKAGEAKTPGTWAPQGFHKEMSEALKAVNHSPISCSMLLAHGDLSILLKHCWIGVCLQPKINCPTDSDPFSSGFTHSHAGFKIFPGLKHRDSCIWQHQTFCTFQQL